MSALVKQTITEPKRHTTWSLFLSDMARNVMLRLRGDINTNASPIDIPNFIVVKLNPEQELHLPFFPSRFQGGPPVILSTGPYINSLWHESGTSKLITKLNNRGYSVICMSHKRSGPQIDLSFDAMIMEDVSKAIDAVLKCLKAQRVFWIGHGLGGNLLLGHMHQVDELQIAGAVLIDTPLSFPHRYNPKRFQLLNLLEINLKTKLKFMKEFNSISNWSGFEELPLDLEESRRMLSEYIDVPSPGVGRQIKGWRRTQRFGNTTDNIDYTRVVRPYDCDVLFMNSPSSPISPNTQMNNVYSLFKANKSMRLHGDWVLSPFETEDVDVQLLSWLDEHRHKCWTDKTDY